MYLFTMLKMILTGLKMMGLMEGRGCIHLTNSRTQIFTFPHRFQHISSYMKIISIPRYDTPSLFRHRPFRGDVDLICCDSSSSQSSRPPSREINQHFDHPNYHRHCWFGLSCMFLICYWILCHPFNLSMLIDQTMWWVTI